MSMKRNLTILAFIGIFGLILLIYFVGFYRPRYESDHPLTPSEARPRLHIEIPETATEIRILDQCVGPGHFLYLLRFNVKLSEGIDWIKKQGVNREEKILENKQSTDRDYPSWFDLQSIKKGSHSSNTGTPIKQIWLDEERQIIYYSESD